MYFKLINKNRIEVISSQMKSETVFQSNSSAFYKQQLLLTVKDASVKEETGAADCDKVTQGRLKQHFHTPAS